MRVHRLTVKRSTDHTHPRAGALGRMSLLVGMILSRVQTRLAPTPQLHRPPLKRRSALPLSAHYSQKIQRRPSCDESRARISLLQRKNPAGRHPSKGRGEVACRQMLPQSAFISIKRRGSFFPCFQKPACPVGSIRLKDRVGAEVAQIRLELGDAAGRSKTSPERIIDE